jgi:hypothetical protein
MKNLLILYLVLIPLQFVGQGIKLVQNPAVIVQKSGQNLINAFAGGMNATQFESVDLNQDGREDIVSFDRTTELAAVFLNKPSGFIYEPIYSGLLPKFSHWMRFVDYDGDGKKDLFCAAPAGIQVFRNTSFKEIPSFESVANPVFTEGFSGRVNLYVSNADIPAIADIDGDGDVDVLAFDPSGHYVEFHQNQSKQSGKVLDFKKIGDCWGDFIVRSCGDIVLGTLCSANIALDAVFEPSRTMHAGNALSVFFNNGVPDLVYGHVGCRDLIYLTNEGSRTTPKFTKFTVGFPKSVNLGTFLHGSVVDVSGDAKPELIASLFSTDNNGYMQDFQQSNVLFSNVNGTWVTPGKTFLQAEMIDVGEQASPCFWDVDQDGDLDLLVANAGIREGNEVKASVSFYENKAGVFVFTTSDFLNLKNQLNATNLLLQTVDYNYDGTKDLILSGQTSQGPRVYVLFKTGLKAVDVPDLGFNEVPIFLDWNQDSQLDLLIVNRAGKIRTNGYSDWGKLGALTNWRLRSFSMADLDGDGSIEFIGLDQDGAVHIGNFDAVKNELIWKSQDFTVISVGRNARILCEDYNSDGKKDLIFGTGAGGVLLFDNQSSSPVWDNLKTSIFQIWPNPSADFIYVLANMSGTVDWFDMTGRIIDQRNAKPGEVIRFDTKGINRGIYQLRFVSDKGQTETQKFVLN